MRRKLSALGITLLSASPLAAQANRDQAAVSAPVLAALRQFCALGRNGKLDTSAGLALLDGELVKQPMSGPQVFPDPDKIVMLKDNLAVARLPAQNPGTPDLYLYLSGHRDGKWTISAGRVLFLPGFVATLKTQLESLITRNAQQDVELRNINLIMQNDASLHKWFANHRTDLDELLTRFRPEKGTIFPSGDRRIESSNGKAAIEQLDANMLTFKTDGSADLNLGGVTDNSVGFLWVPPNKEAPAIDRSNYIWVEPLEGGWYLYRTT